MSAATVSASELTASNDVSELQRQLDSHDALMRDLASRDAQLQTTMSQAQTLDTNIAGKHFISITCVFYDTIRYTVFTCTQKLTNSQLNLPHGIKKKSNEETKNKLEAKGVLLNINCTQATKRAEKCRFLSLVTLTLTFRLVRVRDQTCLHVNLAQNRTQTKNTD